MYTETKNNKKLKVRIFWYLVCALLVYLELDDIVYTVITVLSFPNLHGSLIPVKQICMVELFSILEVFFFFYLSALTVHFRETSM